MPTPVTAATVPRRGQSLRIGAGFAAAMGLGRFVYTPLLPVMTAGAGLSPSAGAQIATANYLGYLLGAALTIVVPRSGDSRALFRACLAGIVASEAAMALIPAPGTAVAVALWWALRLIAGFGSGVVFVHCSRSAGSAAGLGGAFGGVGAGIVLSGLLAVGCRLWGMGWDAQWWVAAAVTAAVAVPAFHASASARAPIRRDAVAPGAAARAATGSEPHRRTASRIRFARAALIVSYLAEGAGYIIIGTFIVAAVAQGPGATPGNVVWIVAGATVVAAMPCWAALRARVSDRGLLISALLLQAIAAVIPAVFSHVAAGFASAVLFGATFVAIVQFTLALGARLGIANSAAVLVTVYSVGQILGPLIVGPVLAHGDAGYRGAFAIAGVILVIATLVAAGTGAAGGRGGKSVPPPG